MPEGKEFWDILLLFSSRGSILVYWFVLIYEDFQNPSRVYSQNQWRGKKIPPSEIEMILHMYEIIASWKISQTTKKLFVCMAAETCFSQLACEHVTTTGWAVF